MNLIIKYIDLLKNIQPETVANYLTNQGWQQQRRIESQAIIWVKNSIESSKLTLVLPLHPEVSDFPITMNLLVENLAKIEEKPQLEIIQKLITNLPNFEIQGLIIEIKSPQGDGLNGEITLMGVVINKLKKIETELFDRDYILAIKGYQEVLPVSCSGDLVKENNSFVLKNISDFKLLSL
ncbi:hypothetical protein [Okeania sp. KiyG1]|uniref:hypothetical protein n=1 Tax=Okeania sp. KiyG1 TaxID=2720165 RepID=UPI001922E109|nr:hypothetical protein [Okeania sp. KiyG1]GGA57755.1 hypothetical protein CYANOKiyG1_78870 [Okeania sp. KiyG1]